MRTSISLLLVSFFLATPLSLMADNCIDCHKVSTVMKKAQSLRGAAKKKFDTCLLIYDRQKSRSIICAKMVVEKELDFINNPLFTSCYKALRSTINYYSDITADRCLGKNMDFPYGEKFMTQSFQSCVTNRVLQDNDTQYHSVSRALGQCTLHALGMRAGDPWFWDFSEHFDSQALANPEL